MNALGFSLLVFGSAALSTLVWGYLVVVLIGEAREGFQ